MLNNKDLVDDIGDFQVIIYFYHRDVINTRKNIIQINSEQGVCAKDKFNKILEKDIPQDLTDVIDQDLKTV